MNQKRNNRLESLFNILILLFLSAGCSGYEFVEVDYTPKEKADWQTQFPEGTGLEREALDELYSRASYLETIYGLLVIKNDNLVAEHYFNGSFSDRKERLQSATKSFTSAMVGIALDKGILKDVNQKMVEFFPEIAMRLSDPRKRNITIKDMLEMRAGYPNEESGKAYWDALLSGHYPILIKEFPLVSDPGTRFHYSNLTSNWLGIIVDRKSGMHLKEFAEENLFSRMNITAGDWGTDADGHNNGCGDLFMTARDAAKFGLLYLNDGVYEGNQLISADWVRDSLGTYSVNEAFVKRIGDFHNIGYGYQWWSAECGKYDVNFAWGHGGQLIVLVEDLDMIVVTTSYPFWLEHNDQSWKNEKAIITLVSRFISSL